MDQAILYKRQHPSESYRTVSDRFDVASSTLQDRVAGTHAAPGKRLHRNLSTAEEDVLLAKIEAYASRGTLLSPQHIKDLAAILASHSMGRNWTSTFLQRHKDRLSLRFYRIQEVARLNADTPETRRAFYSLVSLFQPWRRV